MQLVICRTSDCFYQYVQKLEDCSDIVELKQVCEDYLHQLGGKFFKYAWIPPAITTTPAPISFFTCPDPWLNHCTEQGYNISDPKSRYCNEHSHPVEWSDHIIGKSLSSKEVPAQDYNFWQDTLDMGLGNGATIPIRGIGGSKGMFCIAYEGSYVEKEAAPLPLMEAWAMHLHSHIERLYIAQQLSRPLSEREQEVLKWTVIGKTAEEIGNILNISANTVLFHLNNLRRRLNVSNKHHLIARAFTLRLVEL